MRRILRRNYHGSDHHGAAANYEDHMEQKQEKHKAASPSDTSILAAEAITSNMGNEEDDAAYSDVSPNGEQPDDIQRLSSGRGDHSLNSGEALDPPVTDVLDSAPIPALLAPGYVPFEHNERIVLELPSSMVRPLKVLRGTFQVSSTYLNQNVLCCHYIFSKPIFLMQKLFLLFAAKRLRTDVFSGIAAMGTFHIMIILVPLKRYQRTETKIADSDIDSLSFCQSAAFVQ